MFKRKSGIAVTILLVLMLLTGCTGSTNKGTSDEQPINTTIDTYIKAWLQKDTELLSSVMDDRVYLGSGPSISREGYVEMVSSNWKANGGYDRFTIEDRVIAIDKDRAVVECKWSYRFVGDEYYSALRSDTVMTLWKVDAKWYISSIW